MTTSLAAPALMDTYRRSPVTFVRGRGCTLFDVEGNAYLDMVAGLAVVSVGHCHPAVTAAIATQCEQLVHVSNLYSTEPGAVLAERLSSLTGGMHSFLCNSGAEAVECALKLARKHGGERRTVVAADGGFHGRTLGALSVTGQPAKQAPFEPLVGGIRHVPFGDASALEAGLGPDVAGVLLEPIQGEAGVVVPPEGYLARVRQLCDRSGALLMLDEVQTGLGRTGEWFAYQHDGVVPDVVCLAKGLAAGLPIGACLARPEVAASLVPGDHGSTFGGGPVPTAAAVAVLDVIEKEGLVGRAREAGKRLRGGLGRVFPDAQVRGRGLLAGVVFPAKVAREVAESALRLGLLVNEVAPDVLRLCPPLVVTDAEIDRALEILEEVRDEIGTT